ncbi:hypothetical protein RQM47_16020 [Rubrivirga sp. S365]|uniref:hypothetical protein n=1 Tax=Rubrivirga sp. S365 TaxID=3076080 RepID=UPI0028C793C4|nr:hypothetical protein [Rubrivirga sp. S365]MDT7858155.1 hypothetical protein [Rubrivirga sp. S365]
MPKGTIHEGRSEGRGGTRPPLTVRRSPTGYVLHDPLLVRLAGLDAVPLPFTARAAPPTVLAHLRRLSPHRTVRFDETPAPGRPALPDGTPLPPPPPLFPPPQAAHP